MTADRTAELLKKVRKIEIKTRGLSDQVFSGGYHSAFRGRGMSFSEVREYQYGDDVRNIDWNVTARFDHPFIKVYEEEREITVMLLVDMSGSTFFGTQPAHDHSLQFKQERMAEICAVLAFSAVNNNDKVGMLFFSDRVEKFIPPKKGRNHILRIIRELVDFKPQGKQTELSDALRHLTNMLKKRSVVFILSDFLNTGKEYQDALSIARRRHDVVGLQLYDEREARLPDAGLIRVRDSESGRYSWLDSSSLSLRKQYEAAFEEEQNRIRKRFRQSGADLVSIRARDSYIQALMNLFSMREKRK